MKSKSLQLINAPIASGYHKSSRSGAYPPLSLGTLVGFIRSYSPEISVSIIDGETNGEMDIRQRLYADIVGISCNIMTYDSAIKLAETAHESGRKVILGGPFPTSIPETILRNRPFIDAVVVGDGEIALHKYVNGDPYEEIPNLCFRKGDRIIRNPEQIVDLEPLPHPDYANLPLEKYFQSYEDRYSEYKPFRKSLAIYSRKGCIWRDASNGGCVFCMIPHRGIRYKSPQKLWSEISFFNREHGVNFFWEVCDTFTENSHWIDEFLKSKPAALDVSFHIYGRSSNITRRMARQLKELGVYEVFIGAESGDDRVLTLMNKGIKVDQTRRAVEYLAEEGINVVLSFVFGLPGETDRSVQKTVDLARELYCYGNIVETSSSILLPIPGSNAFDMLMRVPGMREKHGSDVLDLEELKADWIGNFTQTSHAELESALEETLTVFPLNSTFMQRESQSAPMC